MRKEKGQGTCAHEWKPAEKLAPNQNAAGKFIAIVAQRAAYMS